jgi:hypothetical protein
VFRCGVSVAVFNGIQIYEIDTRPRGLRLKRQGYSVTEKHDTRKFVGVQMPRIGATRIASRDLDNCHR